MNANPSNSPFIQPDLNKVFHWQDNDGILTVYYSATRWQGLTKDVINYFSTTPTPLTVDKNGKLLLTEAHILTWTGDKQLWNPTIY